MSIIRVMIVEDDPDWRRGLSAYLAKEADIEVVAAADTAEAALAAAAEARLDVVLMDIMLADSAEGIALTAEISRLSDARIIMLTSLQAKEMMFDAFKAGAVNYIVKSDFNTIPEAVRQAYRHSSPIDAQAAEQMREEFRRLKQLEREYERKQLSDLITPTELQVLSMIEQGHTQTEIADKFVISIRTVKVHVGNILRKLNGKSSKEAAKKAKDMGLL